MEKFNYIKSIFYLDSRIAKSLDTMDEKLGNKPSYSLIVSFIKERNEKDLFTIQHDIEKEYLFPKSQTSDLLKRLEKEGYIYKKIDELDTRKKKLYLTKKGEDLYIQNEKNIKRIEKKILNKFSKEEKRIFRYLLIRAMYEIKED